MHPAGYYGKNEYKHYWQISVHLLTSCVMQGKLINLTHISFHICETKVLWSCYNVYEVICKDEEQLDPLKW